MIACASEQEKQERRENAFDVSGGYKAWQLINETMAPWGELALGVVIAAVSAYLCIHYFLHFINRIGMMPFVIYRLLLGAFLLLWSFIGLSH